MSQALERDVVALPLQTALERLAGLGQVEVKKTYSTKPSKGNGCWRVVRQTKGGGKIFLVVAEELEGIVP